MKALLQRVSFAEVRVQKSIVGSVSSGILLLLGIEKGDMPADMDYIIKKTTSLRIFPDFSGKMNLSVKDIGGSILVVSQFTLASDCRKGCRPSFDNAEHPEKAKKIYDDFIAKLKETGIHLATGSFGEYMEVSLVNDGPVTFYIDSRKQ